jgi:hypothetical protein
MRLIALLMFPWLLAACISYTRSESKGMDYKCECKKP